MTRRLIGTCLAATLIVACREHDAPSPSDVRLVAAPASLGLRLGDTPEGQAGYVAGDSVPRLVVRAADANDADARLCGVLASRSRAPVDIAARWPIDTTLPRLATRFLLDGDVQGVRFVLPGTDARYVFEGITRDGARRVSVRWPVTNDPAVLLPVGAPDSLIERALRPLPIVLDSAVTALRVGAGRAEPRASVTPEDSPSWARAVPLRNDLPLHEVSPTSACPEATVVIVASARIDQVVRVPVRAGDVITADASVPEGTVRIAFDEAPPRTESRERQSVSHASISAASDGRVTLRIRVQVLPRTQAERQPVLIRLVRSRTP